MVSVPEVTTNTAPWLVIPSPFFHLWKWNMYKFLMFTLFRGRRRRFRQFPAFFFCIFLTFFFFLPRSESISTRPGFRSTLLWKFRAYRLDPKKLTINLEEKKKKMRRKSHGRKILFFHSWHDGSENKILSSFHFYLAIWNLARGTKTSFRAVGETDSLTPSSGAFCGATALLLRPISLFDTFEYYPNVCAGVLWTLHLFSIHLMTNQMISNLFSLTKHWLILKSSQDILSFVGDPFLPLHFLVPNIKMARSARMIQSWFCWLAVEKIKQTYFDVFKIADVSLND